MQPDTDRRQPDTPDSRPRLTGTDHFPAAPDRRFASAAGHDTPPMLWVPDRNHLRTRDLADHGFY
jgi:hypothetical protein